jgi:hypothetical protein
MRHGANGAGTAGRLIAAAAALGLTVATWAAPASAQEGPVQPTDPIPVAPVCGGSGDIDDAGGSVFGSCFGNTPGSGPDTSVSSALVWAWYGCEQWRPYAPGSTITNVGRRGELVVEDVLARGLDPTGIYTWNTVECTHVAADGTIEAWSWGFLVIETSPPVDPTVLRDRAVARINPNRPSPASAPMWSEIPAVVNLPTWLWVTDPWEPIEETESRGFVTVVVQARPVSSTWAMGDGGGTVCVGPSVEWAPGLVDSATDCSYTYDAAGAGLTATVSVQWTFHWWLNGNDMGDFGDVSLDTAFGVDVAEIQAIETGN